VIFNKSYIPPQIPSSTAANNDLPVNGFAVVPPESDLPQFKPRGRPPGTKNTRVNKGKPTVSEAMLSSHERWAFFVRAWEESGNCEEVARKTGLSMMTCKSKASWLRKQGVRLKTMPHGPVFNVEDLNKLIDAINESKAHEEFDKVKYGAMTGQGK
jgi:hypothetical protein